MRRLIRLVLVLRQLQPAGFAGDGGGGADLVQVVSLLDALAPEHVVQASNQQRPGKDAADADRYNTRNNQIKFQYYETRTRTYYTNLPRLTASPMMKEDTRMVKTKVSGMDMARNTGPLLAIVHICM